MINININSLIELFPEILVYFVPGFVGVSFYCAATSTKMSWNTKLVSSCVFSFVVVSIFRLFFKGCNPYIEALVSAFFCFIDGFAWAGIRQSKKVKSFFVDRLNYSYSRDAWEDTIDYEKGTMLKVKLKSMDKYVYGQISYMGDVNKDPWISLMNYIFYDEAGNVSYRKTGYEKNFIFNVNEVEYAEAWPVSPTEGSEPGEA